MIDERIIVAGFGGQGVMMIGKLLAHSGMMENLNVSWLPSYGPEMRGGTANCNVILSESIIGAPVVTEATCVIAMNLPSLDKFEPSTKVGGRLLINSSLINRTSKRSDVQVLEIPVNAIANAQGSLKVANVVMLGAYIALSQVVKKETVLEAIEDVLGKSKRHLLDINVKALEEGMKFANAA
ncbi:pyruvate/ketoisovalerate oxidoreductase, gamma subunit [Candidatus Vecturithrix granuli]|uniref:Pyruvate/ketoisovalerate oxidoreductase, gamma subunit n=1 Tax=Vecturithrix granuli TaxID=1499967 RepID=A0A081C5T3_VECG1|nr:pyruvate/ketoisovalerate oxidoreductase, gamma subunit [Candidatus Vecturithrix granuli]